MSNETLNDPTGHPDQQALVFTVDGNTVTTSLAIAEGTNHEHAQVLRLVRTYLADLEEFGRVSFEIRPFETAGGSQQREVALLNEHQATLIIAFMRNIGVVKDFKKRLVKAFWLIWPARSLRKSPRRSSTLPKSWRTLPHCGASCWCTWIR